MAKKKLPAKTKVSKTLKKNKSVKKSAPTKKKSTKTAVKKTTKKKATKKKSKGVDLECFLTTACVHYYQLPDNAYELETLRHYRDTYLLSQENGRDLVKEYYRIAPQIVRRIQLDTSFALVYKYIFKQITKACKSIAKNQPDAAKETYSLMVTTLKRKYNIA